MRSQNNPEEQIKKSYKNKTEKVSKKHHPLQQAKIRELFSQLVKPLFARLGDSWRIFAKSITHSAIII
jgi:hypothetical protein